MRRGPRDVANERQRTLFGVDRLERALGDAISEIIRLQLRVDGLCSNSDPQFVSRDTLHMERLHTWLLEYEETQKAEWNLCKEQLDGAATK